MKSDKYKITQQQAKAQFWENSLFLSPNPLSSKCKAVTNYFVHTSKKEKKKKLTLSGNQIHMWFLPVPSYPVYLLTNFKSNSDLASFRFATNIKNSLLNVLTELQRPQSTKYRFQKFATDSNNFKRAPTCKH